MNGTSTLLADRMASLLPKTTAGACVPASSWTSYMSQGPCLYSRICRHASNGAVTCGTWLVVHCNP